MRAFRLPAISLIMLLLAGCAGEESIGSVPVATADPEALRAASVFLDTGKYDEAQAIVVRAAEVAPFDPDVVALQAELDLSRWKRDQTAGKAQAAIDGFLSAAKLSGDPASQAAYQRNAAVIMSEEGQAEKAIATLRSARIAFPNDLQTLLFLAQVLSVSSEEDPQEVRSLYESVLSLDPDAYPAEVGLAMLDLEAGAYVGARDRITALRVRRPNDRDLRLLHARIERRSGRPGVALNLLSVIPEGDRISGNMTFEYAASLIGAGRWLEAELAFDLHAASRPKDVQLLNWAQALRGLSIGAAKRNPEAQASADRWQGRVDRQRRSSPSG